jgi:hypothetical protein
VDEAAADRRPERKADHEERPGSGHHGGKTAPAPAGRSRWDGMKMLIRDRRQPTWAPGPTRVVVRAGNYQSARVERPFPAQLTAVVVDGTGSALPGVRVTFKITSGSAAFAHGSRTATSTTGGAGIAISQVLAAGPRAGSVRVLATASVVARPTVFSLRVLPAPGRRHPL